MNVKKPGKALGVVSMIFSILSFLAALLGCGCTCCPYSFFLVFAGAGIALILSMVGFILGVIAGKKSKAAERRNVFATIGTILSAIIFVVVLVTSVTLLVLLILVFISGFGMDFWAGVLNELF